MITTQKELRRLFWLEMAQSRSGALHISRKKIRNFAGNGTTYNTDTRCAFVDWLDSLSRNGTISQELAERATL